MLRSVALFLALLLSACGLFPKEMEDTKAWSASKYYTEAKSELNDGNYAAAIKLFEALEARYPYGRYAQQAQLESAMRITRMASRRWRLRLQIVSSSFIQTIPMWIMRIT